MYCNVTVTPLEDATAHNKLPCLTSHLHRRQEDSQVSSRVCGRATEKEPRRLLWFSAG